MSDPRCAEVVLPDFDGIIILKSISANGGNAVALRCIVVLLSVRCERINTADGQKDRRTSSSRRPLRLKIRAEDSCCCQDGNSAEQKK